MIEQLSPDEAQIAKLTPERSREILDSLTERQTEVMEGYARFRKRNEIARDLDLSERMVGKHLENAKAKFGINDRSRVIAAFFIARSQCGRPVFLERDLNKSNQVIERFVSDGRYDDLHQLLTSPEFRQFVRDSRSSGPKGLTAKFGPGWKIGAGLLLVAFAFLIVGAADDVAASLDYFFSQ